MRVRVVAGPAAQRVVVEGKLAVPSVSELKSAWEQARQACRGRIVVDLSGMTFIDSSGRAALLAMIGEGARLTAKGVYNKHLAEELMDKARAASLSETEQV